MVGQRVRHARRLAYASSRYSTGVAKTKGRVSDGTGSSDRLRRTRVRRQRLAHRAIGDETVDAYSTAKSFSSASEPTIKVSATIQAA